MNSKLSKLIRVKILFIAIFALVLCNEAQSQNSPQITCPEESVVNICAPVGIPALYALEDFKPVDDNTPSSEIEFDIDQTVTTQTDLTIVSHTYTFTDKDGNSNTCEVVYNIANRFLEAPRTKEQSPICQGDLFAGVKLGAGDYRIYADNNGSQGEFLGLCDNPGILCAAEKLGIDGLTASANQVWISHYIIFPDASICESPASALEIEVLEKPEARLSTSSALILPGEIITLMDFVEENVTGYWSGDNISSIATADGKTAWVFSSTEIGYAKLFYTVKNGPCSESYSLIIQVQDPAPPPPPPPPPPVPGAPGADGPSGPGGYSGGYSTDDFSFGTSGGSPPSSGSSGPPSTDGGDPPPPPDDYPYPPPPPTEQPDAGLITAGEWNDLDNWEFLDTLLNENDYFEMPEYWGFYPYERVSVLVKSNDDLPLFDVTVELTYNDRIKWTAKTDNKGSAELWPALYENEPVDVSNLGLIVNGEAIRGSVLLYEDGVNEITINSRPSDVSQVELSFIVDATGSMSDELEFLKRDLRDVIRKVEDTTSNLNILTSTVFYRDVNDDYLVRQSEFTNDIDETLDFIQDQAASGGGDFPEAVHTALSTCVNNLQWSANAKTRLAFLLLDAPPHYTDEIKADLHATVQQAAAKGIKIIPITASGIDKETEFLMRFFAMATNGTYTFITNDSGIGNNHIEPSIGDFDVEKLNDLLVRLILQYTN